MSPSLARWASERMSTISAPLSTASRTSRTVTRSSRRRASARSSSIVIRYKSAPTVVPGHADPLPAVAMAESPGSGAVVRLARLRHNRGMDRSVLWRTAGVQAAAVAVLSVALAVALPHSFFEDWGWIAGPAAWMLCALVTAAAVRLPPARVLVGAVLAGLPSLLAVVLGVHWLGAAIAIVLFALWCARLAREPELPARAV